MVRSPELSELRTFCAAVELGSLGCAAVRLRISQQAVSKRLLSLEALVGVRLFTRSRHGVRMTRAGRVLYEEAVGLLANADALQRRIAGLAGEHAPVRVAASPTIVDCVLPWQMAAMERDCGFRPTLELSAVNSATAIRLVAAGLVDIAIAAIDDGQPLGHLVELPLLRDEVVLAVPLGHHWAAMSEVPVRAFLSTPLVMRDPESNTQRTVERALRDKGLELAPALLELGSTVEIREVARRRTAPALLSKLTAAGVEGFVVRRVVGLKFERYFSLLLAGETSLGPDARALIEHLRKTASV
jgi:DNA-binding transcriptional LysR family regulator